MMDQMNRTYGAMGSNVIVKDEFNDLKLVDQYIPLEDVYVENLYPFDNNPHQNGYSGGNTGSHYAQYHHHHQQYYSQHNQSNDSGKSNLFSCGLKARSNRESYYLNFM